MAKTSGGLEKLTVALKPLQKRWLEAEAARRGDTSIAAIFREWTDVAMHADRQPVEIPR